MAQKIGRKMVLSLLYFVLEEFDSLSFIPKAMPSWSYDVFGLYFLHFGYICENFYLATIGFYFRIQKRKLDFWRFLNFRQFLARNKKGCVNALNFRPVNFVPDFYVFGRKIDALFSWRQDDKV